MKPKIGTVALGITDFEKPLRFYRDGLGFRTHDYKNGEDAEMV